MSTTMIGRVLAGLGVGLLELAIVLVVGGTAHAECGTTCDQTDCETRDPTLACLGGQCLNAGITSCHDCNCAPDAAGLSCKCKSATL